MKNFLSSETKAFNRRVANQRKGIVRRKFKTDDCGLPSVSELKKDFKKRMARLAADIAQIQKEETRVALSELQKLYLVDLRHYRNRDKLYVFMIHCLDTLRTGTAIALYGIMDPRTQKLMEQSQETAMERAMMKEGRDTRRMK